MKLAVVTKQFNTAVLVGRYNGHGKLLPREAYGNNVGKATPQGLVSY